MLWVSGSVPRFAHLARFHGWDSRDKCAKREGRKYGWGYT
ncbi:hypothetical protein HMPREF0724_13030 [Prescottella equi ATCC 33707]|uniref:Uncharacterized protein n=1 Tax=Prescottella equi ATCC 33707 TaxID=525370 RepID=E9T301_RHOHA|nr:hypothetical protein HMPREF0724_13030 [Prescottella equi ATCC 33707]